jgi:predicted DsbA family dithiol-disulfide isomerase
MKIAFVSDVTCPWCAIGLAALEQALAELPNVPVDLQFEPFELNPDIPPDGEALDHYAARKYGTGARDLAQRQAMIRDRAATVGLRFIDRTRVWNTFDAHRLLHWAHLEGRQRDLKRALLEAYHARAENPASHDVLLMAAAQVGLDPQRAEAILASDEFAAEVRRRTQHWMSLGIHAVPSVVVDGQYLIAGARSAEDYAAALREICNRPMDTPARGAITPA